MPEGIVTAVINWNGWRDTVTCAESLRGQRGPAFHLLVCDNGSTDDSHERLCEWARDALHATAGEPQAVADGHVTTFVATTMEGWGALQSVQVMRLSTNFGYAGAINRCIAWSRNALAPSSYWLLNNDVWAEPRALEELTGAVRTDHHIGLCGSVLLEWDAPHAVQAIGGIFHRTIAVGDHLKRLPAEIAPDQALYFGIDYPVGASLMVTHEFIESVGLMDEGYFLYYEEMDWAMRGRALGFRPAVALRSRVRHKEGASTGSVGVRGKSMLSEHYGVVNRLRFTRKFSPRLVPIVWLSLLLVAADRIVHGEWKRAVLVLRLMVRPGSSVHARQNGGMQATPVRNRDR
jgi:GT2 family glycosyltransferase